MENALHFLVIPYLFIIRKDFLFEIKCDAILVITLQPFSISKENKDDLISLLNLIADIFHKFYMNLPTANDL